MKKTVVAKLGEHFSSMGTSHSYQIEDGPDWCYGLPLADLFPKTQFGTGAKFRVTVEVLERGKPETNPWRKK